MWPHLRLSLAGQKAHWTPLGPNWQRAEVPNWEDSRLTRKRRASITSGRKQKLLCLYWFLAGATQLQVGKGRVVKFHKLLAAGELGESLASLPSYRKARRTAGKAPGGQSSAVQRAGGDLRLAASSCWALLDAGGSKFGNL